MEKKTISMCKARKQIEVFMCKTKKTEKNHVLSPGNISFAYPNGTTMKGSKAS